MASGPSSRSESDGDRRAIDEALRQSLSARYRAPLMAFFARRTGDSAEAEDLAQEVLLRVVQRDDLGGIEQPDAFIFQTARNLLKDRARQTEVRDRNLGHYKVLADDIEGLSPERVTQSRQDLAAAMRALGALKETTRDMFILHRLEGMRHKDIAALYGCSVSSVEKHIIKAIAHLLNSTDEE